MRCCGEADVRATMSRTPGAMAAWGEGSAAGRAGSEFPACAPAAAAESPGIIILVVLFFALRACGIDPMAVLTGGDPGVQTQERTRSPADPIRRAGIRRDEAVRVDGSRRDRGRLERHLPGGRPYLQGTQAHAVLGPDPLRLRLCVLRLGTVLLPGRPAGLSRHGLLRPARPAVRRGGRFRRRPTWSPTRSATMSRT